MAEIEGSSNHLDQRRFGPVLTGAINDFLTRLVVISGTAVDKQPAEIEKEGLEVLVRGVGMTLGCMEVCNRDPCAESLGMRGTLASSQERILLHLRHLHQLTVCAHRDVESCGNSGDGGMGAQVRDVRIFAFVPMCMHLAVILCLVVCLLMMLTNGRYLLTECLMGSGGVCAVAQVNGAWQTRPSGSQVQSFRACHCRRRRGEGVSS